MARPFHTVQQRIVDALARSGLVDQVTTSDPSTLPAGALIATVVPDNFEPFTGASGLDVSTYKATYLVRLYINSQADPIGGVPTRLMDAVDGLLAGLHALLGLNETGHVVDVFGMAAEPLSARFGYLPLGRSDGGEGLARVADVTVPVVLFDLYQQTI